jgi:general stress protein 26
MEKKSDEKERPLMGEEAIKKMKELVGHNTVCMFTSNMEQVPLQTRPMTVQEVDDEGNFWFFSAKDSHKNYEVKTDNRVQLLFANTSNSEYLTVNGRAAIVEDRSRIEEMWSPLVKAWFEQGKNDPNLTLIKVIPEDAYYWEPKYNKMVTLFKMAASAISGKPMDIGEQGRLEGIGV